jgi:hypothetical protein
VRVTSRCKRRNCRIGNLDTKKGALSVMGVIYGMITRADGPHEPEPRNCLIQSKDPEERCCWQARRPGGSLARRLKPIAADINNRRTENLAIHHNFPCVHGKVGVIKAPVKLFRSDGFVCYIMVWRNVLVFQRLSGVYPFSGIEYQHPIQQIDG